MVTTGPMIATKSAAGKPARNICPLTWEKVATVEREWRPSLANG